MELKFEVNTQEIVDKVLERIKDEFIPKSVIEDIKAELISDYNNNADNWNYCAGIHRAIELIDNRISGKETWNGYHGQITAPKGTFERIFNEADDDNDI